MKISGIQKTSTIDFPGYLSCVLFTQGCNLNCFYCHNRDLISTNKEAAIPLDYIFDFLNKRRGMLDGVVISGGEPTLQKDLPEFIDYIRKNGYRVKLDTNGQNPAAVEKLLQSNRLDYIAVDWKVLAEDSLSVCGNKNTFNKAKETIEFLHEADVPFEVRTTLYPGLTIEQLKRLVSKLPAMPLYRLNFFHMPEVFVPDDLEQLQSHSLTPAEIESSMEELKQIQPNLVL